MSGQDPERVLLHIWCSQFSDYKSGSSFKKLRGSCNDGTYIIEYCLYTTPHFNLQAVTARKTVKKIITGNKTSDFSLINDKFMAALLWYRNHWDALPVDVIGLPLCKEWMLTTEA